MKDFYNLVNYVDLANFPWEEVNIGLAKSQKNASIFYGHEKDESEKLQLLSNKRYLSLTGEQKTWYRVIGHGQVLKGLDVLLTNPLQWKDAWFRLDEPEYWKPVSNAAYFPELLNWIKNCGIFLGTGRIIFFIQLQGGYTPPHIDENINMIPEKYSKIREFIWLTPPSNPKKLLVNGTPTGNLVWFNSYARHETLVEDNVRWSLRIDGKFTTEFKQKLGVQ